MPTLKKIKDPLYGYVYYSRLEERFLSHRFVLRLHNIRQNGAAFLVYPSLRVHRFEHSVGAMHIAGAMFSHAVRFARQGDLPTLIADILDRIGIDTEETLKGVRRNSAKVKGEIFLDTDGLYTLYGLARPTDRGSFAILLVFQAVRVAALVHDIGHPPFSHTFETALKQLRIEGYENHEITGLRLLQKIIKEINDDLIFGAGEWDFGNAVAKVARILIDKKDPHHSELKGLADIVSSEIDCDRLDYVRRDSQSAGVTTNSYDLGRLLDAIDLGTALSVDMPHHSIRLSWTAQALSTMEAFFSVRFHLYRWVLWHHAVVRQNMALVLITIRLYQLRKLQLSYLLDLNIIVNDMFEIATDPGRIEQDYWFFDDHYLMVGLQKIYVILKDREVKGGNGWVAHPNERTTSTNAEWGIVADLYKFLKTFLFRDKGWLVPMWKRPDQYQRFAGCLVGKGEDSSRRFNDELRNVLQSIAAQDAKDLGVGADAAALLAENIEYYTGKLTEKIDTAINLELRTRGIRCRARSYYLAKFSAAPVDMKLTNDGADGGLLRSLSPSVVGLQDAWMNSPHLWLFREFYAYEDNGDKADVQAIRDDETLAGRVDDAAVAALASLFASLAAGTTV